MAATIVSMAMKSSDLEDQTSGANLQMEGHMGMPSQSQKDPEEMEALGSSPFHLPSWFLARRLPPSCPNTRHCLGIHVTLTKEAGVVSPLPPAWTVLPSHPVKQHRIVPVGHLRKWKRDYSC